MANIANRFKLASLRKLLASLHLPFDHLYPLTQYVRPKTQFEVAIKQGLRLTRELNRTLPGYRKYTTNPKKVRRLARFIALGGTDTGTVPQGNILISETLGAAIGGAA